MPLRAAARLIALWTFAGAPACVRDVWMYPRQSADAASDDAPAPDAGTTDLGATDVRTADVGTTDVTPADSGSACPAGMALIRAGQFLMGDSTGLEPLSLPVHGVRLSAFCMDVTEVTVAAYEACPTARCTTPATLPACNWGVTGRTNHPINCVTFEQALAYCEWRSGAGLPTEAQWEYAARGTDNRLYPWGNDPPGSQLCWSGAGTIQTSTCPIRSFPAGASPFGLADMGGGVVELTSGWYYAYSGDAGSVETDPQGPATGSIRAIRGSNWRSTGAGEVRASYRLGLEVPFSTGVGFRCARLL